MDQITRHAGRWTLEDRFGGPWHYLPVEVPSGRSGIRVELDYDRAAATLDLGCLGPAGFRGWSGGARSSFVISVEDATPGYLRGELEPGTWQVIIGICRVQPEGVAYRLTATVADTPGGLRGDPRPAPPPSRARPASCSRFIRRSGDQLECMSRSTRQRRSEACGAIGGREV